MRMMMARVQLRRLRGLAALVGVLLLASAAPAVDAQAGRSELVLLTTTTTQDSGMLTILVDAFEKRGYRVTLQNIAAKPALFISRGDQSGTHVRELSLWQRLGLNPKGQPWYRETGQGQALTMDVASHQRAYALTDRGTFLVHAQRLDLVVLVEHDPLLRNIYHVMPVNPQKFPKVNAPAAQAFADFLVSEAGQRLIGDFGIAQYGQSLFTPAAHHSEAELVRE